MAGSRIGMVHLPCGSRTSGGNVYNERLLQYARRNATPLDSVPWQPDALAAGAFDTLVWDSLLLNQLQRLGCERIGLLLHYLPSLDPTLDVDAKRAREAAEDRAAGIADFAIATGHAVAAVATARWPRLPVSLCEPGVDDTFLRREAQAAGTGGTGGTGNTGNTIHLLTVANLLPAKGHAPLVGILQGCAHLPWQWHLMGDGGADDERTRGLRERLVRAGLDSRVTLHGCVPQHAVAASMAACDILVAPSLFESYGMALAEAVAVGLPAVAFRVGAAEQLIAHGVTGLLATPGDWVEFGRHLQRLLLDAALRPVLRANLRNAPVRRWDATLAEFRRACEGMRALPRRTGGADQSIR